MASPAPSPPRPRSGRLRTAFWITGTSGLAVTGALTSLWLARDWTGERVAVEYLRRRGVPAQIRLTRLDMGGVEGSATLGPPSAPTLIAPAFRVEFDPLSGLRAPRVSRIVLERPELAVRWNGRRFDLGALQPLMEEALQAPKTRAAAPAPHVQVSAGFLRVASAYGEARAVVDADVAPDGLRAATLRLLPVRLAAPSGGADALAGELRLRGAGGGYDADLSLTAAAVHGAPGRANGVRAGVHAHLPRDFSGATRGDWRVEAADAVVTGCRLSAPVLAGDWAGDLRQGDRPGFLGRAAAHADASTAAGARATLRAPHAELALSHLFAAQGTVAARFAGGVRAPSGVLPVAGERIALAALDVAAQGRLAFAPRTPATVEARLSLSAAAGLAPKRAAALAAKGAPGEYGGDLQPTLRAALTRSALSLSDLHVAFDGRSWRGGGAPMTVEGGRARLTLTAPAWTLGGGVFDAPRLSARLEGPDAPTIALDATAVRGALGGARAAISLTARGSAGPLRDANLTASGRAETDGAGVRVVLAECAPVRLGRFMGGEGEPRALAQALSGELCSAAGAPLLTLARDGGWRASAVLRGLKLQAPLAELAVADGEGELELRSAQDGATGAVQVRAVALYDTSKPLRFRPLSLSGPLRLEGERIIGTLRVALASPAASLGPVLVEQDFATGATRLSFHASGLKFTPGALQPASVLPGLAALGQDVTGAADVDFDLGLKGARTTSFVHARAVGLQIRTAAGLAQGVDADVTLTALDPLTSPPDQRVTLVRVVGPAPLTGLEARFRLGDQALRLASAWAGLAGGVVTLDPMRIGLQPGDTMAGTLHADGVELGGLLDALNLSKAVKVDARLQGVLPFSFGPRGLRFSDGRLQATAPGRLSLDRAAISGAAIQGATPTASPSAVQDFAYKALEDLTFSELDAAIASRPQGRLGVVLHIRGRHEPPVGESDRIPLIALLRGHAFDDRIPLPKGTEVNLTLDSSLNLDDLIAAYPSLSSNPPASAAQSAPPGLPQAAGSAQVQPQGPRS